MLNPLDERIFSIKGCMGKSSMRKQPTEFLGKQLIDIVDYFIPPRKGRQIQARPLKTF
jgi:hypothetical protein